MLFSEKTTVGDLKLLVQRPKFAALRDRMRAVILRRQGKTFREIASTLNRSLDFVKCWNDRFKSQGAPGLESLRPQKVITKKLTLEQREELRKRINRGPQEADGVSVFTIPFIQKILSIEFGVNCSVSTISKTLRAMNFRKVKPRPIHPKNSKETMEKWQTIDLPLF